MKNFFKLLMLTMMAFLLGFSTGCSSKHKLVPGGPDWVNKGSGAFEDKNEKLFYGVGVVTGITSKSLATATADQRARADLAKQLDTYVTGLYRDYQSSTSASMAKNVIEEQHVEESLKTMTKISLRGAKIVDHWREPETNTIYSLGRLDLKGITATLDELDKMDPSLRDYIRSNSEKAFDKLLDEEKRR